MTQSSDAIVAKNIVKQYPGVLALDNVSIVMKPGEIRAVLGKNGAGKSTLIRALTGAETPDSGEIYIGGILLNESAENRPKQSAMLGVHPVYQELSLIPDMSVAENMFLGNWPKQGYSIDLATMYQDAAQIIQQLRFPLDPRERLNGLGPAKRQMVEIARAMLGTPRLIILDEPTSSLSSEEVELLFNAIRSMAERDVAILYVSHRMKEIRTIADTATVLRDGKIIETFSVRDTSTDAVIEMMLGSSAQHRHPVKQSPQLGVPVLSVKQLAVRGKFVDANFELRAGEVLGIAGLLGSGRTELLRVIAGLDDPVSGQIDYCDAPLTGGFKDRIQSGIAITPENRKDDGIFPQLGLNENLVLADTSKVSSHGVFDATRVASATQSIIDRMSVKASNHDTPIDTLSGGNQQKIVIGRWIYAGAKLMLLDEPTRGVDVEAKSQIYDLVRALAVDGKSIIFVSSEIEELALVCDRVLVLKDGRLEKEFIAPDIDTDKLMAATIS